MTILDFNQRSWPNSPVHYSPIREDPVNTTWPRSKEPAALCRWEPRCQQLLSEFCPHFLRQSVVRGAQSFRSRIIFYQETFASRK